MSSICNHAFIFFEKINFLYNLKNVTNMNFNCKMLRQILFKYQCWWILNAGKKSQEENVPIGRSRYPTDAVYHIVVDHDEVYWGVKNVCSDFLTVSPPADGVHRRAGRCSSAPYNKSYPRSAGDQPYIARSARRPSLPLPPDTRICSGPTTKKL